MINMDTLSRNTALKVSRSLLLVTVPLNVGTSTLLIFRLVGYLGSADGYSYSLEALGLLSSAH